VATGPLGIVEAWQQAVNAGDAARLLAVSAPGIEVGGPRGSGHGHALLLAWLERAGIRLEPLRWFCGAAGVVVVEQAPRWNGERRRCDAPGVLPPREGWHGRTLLPPRRPAVGADGRGLHMEDVVTVRR
jgi:hypothetical protein